MTISELKDQLQILPSPLGMTKEEIVELLLTEEYGFLPEVPQSISAKVLDRYDNFCAGKAFLETIELTCHTKDGDFVFPVRFTCPAGTDGPIPCVIHINFRDLVPDRYEPSEEIVDQGVAVLSFCYQDVTSDSGDFTNGLAGLVYPSGERTNTQCGKIGLWSWAASRVLDYALTRPELDYGRICVAGHSRLGKTALLTGALDERFFCAYSNDSGCSGAAIARGTRGETVKVIYDVFPYWFCKNYGKYQDNEENMPFDQHFLVAANAPHRVYVASAEQDIWADPEKEYESCVAASAYYEAQGLKGFVHPDRLPEPGDYFGEGMIGYHLRTGTHYFSRVDWQHLCAFLTNAIAQETGNRNGK